MQWKTTANADLSRLGGIMYTTGMRKRNPCSISFALCTINQSSASCCLPVYITVTFLQCNVRCNQSVQQEKKHWRTWLKVPIIQAYYLHPDWYGHAPRAIISVCIFLAKNNLWLSSFCSTNHLMPTLERASSSFISISLQDRDGQDFIKIE